MNKFKARIKYQSLRDNLSADDLLNHSIKIANNCLDLPIWDKNYYHLYLSIKNKNEVDTNPILNILNGKDKKVIVSKSNFNDLTLSNYILDNDTILKINKYGIPEPINGNQIQSSKIDVVFIPLLAFDKNGNRVGYGKGFYDRFLKNLSPQAIKIGLSYFGPENNIDDIEKHDILLDYCICPQKVFNFL